MTSVSSDGVHAEHPNGGNARGRGRKEEKVTSVSVLGQGVHRTDPGGLVQEATGSRSDRGRSRLWRETCPVQEHITLSGESAKDRKEGTTPRSH